MYVTMREQGPIACGLSGRLLSSLSEKSILVAFVLELDAPQAILMWRLVFGTSCGQGIVSDYFS